jgi:hypothetical protein
MALGHYDPLTPFYLQSLQQGIGDAAGAWQQAQQSQRLQALAQALGGAPASQPGLPGAGQGDVRGFTPPTPGMISGLDANQAQALLSMPGGADALVKALVAQRFPQQPPPITPYQQQELALKKEGLGIQRDKANKTAGITPYQQEQLDIRRQQLQMQREKMAASGNSKGAKLSDVRGMRQEFTKQSGDFIQVRDAYGKLQESAKNPSAAGDLAMIFNYMKMLDPGSVVREGEFATAQNAAGVPDRVRNYYNRMMSGERLNPEQRTDFVNSARTVFGSQLKFQQQNEKAFGDIAKREGIDPANVIVDYVGELRNPAGSSAATVSASPSTISQVAAGDLKPEDVSKMSIGDLVRLDAVKLSPEARKIVNQRLDEAGF